MMILQAFGAGENFEPVRRAYARIIAQGFAQAQAHAQAHAFVWARLIPFNSGDLRWAIAAMTLRLLGAAWAFAERQFAQWAQRVLRRAWHGARLAAQMSDADTMVAAGRR